MKVTSNVDEVIEFLEDYKNSLHYKMKLLLESLSEKGLYYAEWGFGTAQYDGKKDVDVKVEWSDDDTSLKIIANGKSVAFIEFGSGPYGFGHPDAARLGFGPGTWSDGPMGKHHWQQRYGWWYNDENGVTQHSYGNVAAEAMRGAAEEMKAAVEEEARRIFTNG